jgi:plasmid stabilization system protein ParE
LKPRRVRFTATAQQHVRREKTWWIENRIHQDVFVAEFEEAIRVLALLPGAGAAYPQAGIPGVRRFYVPKVACHVYYTFDERQVIVRALWGARREHGPRFGS